MADQNSLLNIRMALSKTGSGDKDAARGLEDTTKAGEKNTRMADGLKNAWKGVQGGLVAAGLAFIASVPAMVDQGIAIERANTALIAYTGSSQEAQAAIDGIIAATGNSISKFDAAQSATKLFSMGLADNAEEAANLTKIATTLGATMGKDAKGAFEEFTLMLANQSILRLDTFGISGAEVKDRMQELADEGFKPADRQARFLAATLEVAGTKMGQLDAAGFQAASSVDRLKANIQNAKDATATWLADGLLPIIDGLYALDDAQKDNTKTMVDAAGSYDEYRAEVQKALDTNLTFFFTGEVVSEALFDEMKAAEAAKEAIDDLGDQTEDTTEVTEDLTFALEANARELDIVKQAIGGGIGPAWDDFQDKVEKNGALVNHLTNMLAGMINKGVDPASKEYQELVKQMQDANEEIVDAQENIKQLTSELIFNHLAAGLDAEATLELGRSLGLLDEATYNTLSQSEDLRQQWDALDGKLDGVIQNTDGYAAAAARLRDSLLGIPANRTSNINVHTNYSYSGSNQPAGAAASAFANHYGGYATGGEFDVKGTPGNDRVPVQFNASAGERVKIIPQTGAIDQQPGAQSGGGGRGGLSIGTVNINNGWDMEAFKNEIRNTI